MSTRCQVKVTQNGQGWSESVTLYHHTDGYPEYMVPIIARAFHAAGDSWRASRAGKVAGFLCAVDPGVFEPETGHDLHGDIEYYYILTVGKGWTLKVCTVSHSSTNGAPKLRTLHRAQKIGTLEKKYPDKWGFTLNPQDVKITVTAEPEHIPIRGNLIASGDDALDKKEEDSLIAEIDRTGNVWLWCTVTVKASFKGFEGYDYLGACSYDSEEKFCAPDGYFPDMKRAAIQELQNTIQADYRKLQALMFQG